MSVGLLTWSPPFPPSLSSPSVLVQNAQFKKTLTDPDKMEAARQAFLENDEWQNTFDDPDLKAMASGACVYAFMRLRVVALSDLV